MLLLSSCRPMITNARSWHKADSGYSLFYYLLYREFAKHKNLTACELL